MGIWKIVIFLGYVRFLNWLFLKNIYVVCIGRVVVRKLVRNSFE